MPYRNYSDPAPEREGACSRDIWRIYNMVPVNSSFTLAFYDNVAAYFHHPDVPDEEKRPLACISFMKCGNPMDPLTVEDYTNQMKAAFRRFGYSGYYNVRMEWQKGFGSAVTVLVLLGQDCEGREAGE